MQAAAAEAPAEEVADAVPASVEPALTVLPAAAEFPAEESVEEAPAVVEPEPCVQLASSGKQQMKPERSPAAHGKPAASAAPAAHGGSAAVLNLTEKVVARRGERPPPELAPP